MGVDATQWITAAGYFFKTMSGPGDQQVNTTVDMPVLIGKSVTLLSGPPGGPGGDPTALDPSLQVYKFIRDKTRIAGRPRLSDFDTPWEESAAYDRIVRHAARFPAEVLEQHARTDLKFADLFEDASAPGYRLQLVKLEGRLISAPPDRSGRGDQVARRRADVRGLRWCRPTSRAWQPGVQTSCSPNRSPISNRPGRVNKWVSFPPGTRSRRCAYESRAEPDPKNPATTPSEKYAPLLIGLKPDLAATPTNQRPRPGSALHPRGDHRWSGLDCRGRRADVVLSARRPAGASGDGQRAAPQPVRRGRRSDELDDHDRPSVRLTVQSGRGDNKQTIRNSCSGCGSTRIFVTRPLPYSPARLCRVTARGPGGDDRE